MSFGARLAEERKRMGLRQAEFADMAGVDSAKQSLYENGRRELRADYLARLADAEVDVLYILTGRRAAGEWLGQDAATLVSAYLSMPPAMQRALENVAAAMRDQVTGGRSPTVHAATLAYRSEERARKGS